MDTAPKDPTSQIRVLSRVVHTETPRWKWFATAGPKTEFLVIFWGSMSGRDIHVVVLKLKLTKENHETSYGTYLHWCFRVFLYCLLWCPSQTGIWWHCCEIFREFVWDVWKGQGGRLCVPFKVEADQGSHLDSNWLVSLCFPDLGTAIDGSSCYYIAFIVAFICIPVAKCK